MGRPAAVDLTRAARVRALVVDDDPVGAMTLKALLTQLGYEVVIAADGSKALECFHEARPAIVFMDVVMPVMDGFEAAARIKESAGDDFVPVIFVTGVSEEQEIVHCIDAGGDDFIVKPYSRPILAAKIRAMERIVALHARARALGERIRDDQRLAERVFSGAVMGANVLPPGLHAHLAPADIFSGDLVLTAYTPAGELHVLLGDFTGHGLAAALGALPVAETFRSMTGKGFAPAQILGSINAKLRVLLPTGMFLAAVFVRITGARISVCNCGMPEAWLVADGRVVAGFGSTVLPLGIIAEDAYETGFATRAVEPGQRLLLASDGALEAPCASGEAFGAARLRAALEAAGECDATMVIARAIDAFRGATPLADDVSLIDVHIGPALFPETRRQPAPVLAGRGGQEVEAVRGEQRWRIEIELSGATLRETDPVPLLMSHLSEFPELEAKRPELFTVLAELYNNALDHGVLGLDSSLKNVDFALWLAERERRLAELCGASVRLALTCYARGCSGEIEIEVEDSGPGFDCLGVAEVSEDARHGRGIRLVRALCDSLFYEEKGKRARALYAVPPGSAGEP